jgi:gliding motility-associated-like protein
MTTFTTDANGTYELILSATNGVCFIEDTVEIILDPYPTSLFTATPEICNGSVAILTFDLTGEAPYEVVYFDGVINDTTISSVTPVEIMVSPSVTTTYTLVSVTDNNSCTIYPSTQKEVLVTPQPIANAGPDAELCFNLLSDSYQLSASQNVGSGVWTSSPIGLTFSSLTDPDATVTSSNYGDFELIWMVDTSICFDSDTLDLMLKEIPTATISAATNEICIGSAADITFSMTGIPPFTIQYNDGNTNQNIVGITGMDTTISVSPTSDNTYTLLSVSSANSCDSLIAGQSVTITVDEMPNPNAGQDDVTCWALSDTYQLDGSTDIGTTIWTFEGPGNVTFADETLLNTTLQIDDYGSYEFILTATNNTCSASDSVEVVFNEYPTAFIVDFGDTVICEGTSTFVEIEFTGTPPWGIIYNDGQGNDTIENIMISPYQVDLTPLVTTTYTLSAAFDVNQCQSTDASIFTITVFELPIPVINTPSSSVCGDQTVIEAQTPNAGVGQWSADNNITFLPNDMDLSVVALTDQFGMYTVTWMVTNNICEESTSIDIDYQEDIPEGSVYAGSDQLLFFEFETQMDALLPSFAEGTWQLISGEGNVVSENNPNSEVTGLEFGVSNYLWTVENGVCPAVIDSMKIEVRPIQETSGFSPNGDGINDVYVINGLENSSGNEFVVFNNWGDVVYKATNYANDWDGSGLNGKALPSDTYYYILKITGIDDFSGYIIIKR